MMLIYNAILVYNLIFNSYGGAGFTWWFYLLILNGLHSIVLLIYFFVTCIRNKSKIGCKSEIPMSEE